MNIFKHIQENYGQDVMKIARKIKKYCRKIANIKYNIMFLLYIAKKITWQQASQDQSLLLDLVTTYGIKYHVKY